jgi:hypothetical protein
MNLTAKIAILIDPKHSFRHAKQLRRYRALQDALQVAVSHPGKTLFDVILIRKNSCRNAPLVPHIFQ